MITSIRIDDNKKTPFKYIPKIKAFKNGSEFIFKPGVNVIVGKNGSGKSTLLNMISKYMLCEKKMCSELPSEALYFPDIFDDDKVLDGISIKSDYIGKVFHLLQQTEMRNDDILNNINNLSLYMNGASILCLTKMSMRFRYRSLWNLRKSQMSSGQTGSTIF